MESSIRYLEGKLKLKVNREKSHIAKVNATKNFKFLGFAYSKGKRGTVHSSSPESAAESKEQATRNHEAKPRSECPKGHAGNKSLHDGMAELLRDSVNEAENGTMGRMASTSNPSIHLEAMEETENQIKKPCEAGRAGILRIYGSQQPKGLLVYGEHRSCEKRHNKRKAHTRRVL